MKAIVLSETGGPEQLVLQDVPEPDLSEGQSLVHVRAAGVNFLDLLIRKGVYPQAPPLPTILGAEVAGETDDGRRVVALLTGGGYAERVAVDEARLFPLPDNASFAEGAAFLLTYLTVWIPLTRQVRAGAGADRARARGLGRGRLRCDPDRATPRRARRRHREHRGEACVRGRGRRGGAYGYDDFAEHVQPDLIVDPVGGEVFAASLKALAPLGTIVGLGSAGGWWEDLSPALLVGRNIGIQGFYLGRLMGHQPELVRQAAGELGALWAEGALRPRRRRAVPARARRPTLIA